MSEKDLVDGDSGATATERRDKEYVFGTWGFQS